jgi:hypothetical protein
MILSSRWSLYLGCYHIFPESRYDMRNNSFVFSNSSFVNTVVCFYLSNGTHKTFFPPRGSQCLVIPFLELELLPRII